MGCFYGDRGGRGQCGCARGLFLAAFCATQHLFSFIFLVQEQ